MAFPIISDRESIVDATGYDRLKKLGEIWIFGKSIYNDTEYLKKH